MDSDKLRQEFQDELRNEMNHEYLITERKCSSDRYEGVEFVIEAEYVPIAPILRVLRRHDELFAEHLGAAPETSESRVVVFVVDGEFSTAGKSLLDQL